MRSNDRFEGLDFEHDLPTTAEDVAALRRAAKQPPLDLDGYLRFLAQLPPIPATASAWKKRLPQGVPPFEL